MGRRILYARQESSHWYVIQKLQTSKNWRCNLSQAANTFWDNRYNSSARANSVSRQRVRYRRFIDGVIMTVILAAAAICFSVYTRTRTELRSAVNKHQEMAEKVGALAGQVEKIEREVKQLRTDARVIESFARQRFGFVRSGDVVIKLQQEQQEARSQAREVQLANLTPQQMESYTKISN
jgi:cell division protein FtsB